MWSSSPPKKKIELENKDVLVEGSNTDFELEKSIRIENLRGVAASN